MHEWNRDYVLLANDEFSGNRKYYIIEMRLFYAPRNLTSTLYLYVNNIYLYTFADKCNTMRWIVIYLFVRPVGYVRMLERANFRDILHI